MVTSKKILVLDNSPDLLELSRILLSAEGYDVATSSYEGIDLATIKQHAPEVILFDLVKDREEPWLLLKELRGDPEMRSVGVMVTLATPALIDRAMGDPSLQVSSGLVMPFDIDDLYARLEETLDSTRSPLSRADSVGVARHPGAVAVARIMADERRNILFRWVQRISTLTVYRRQADLDLRGVTGEMQGILELLTAQMGQPGAAIPTMSGLDDMRELGERHVRLRTRQGVSVVDVVREYQLLRSEVAHAVGGALHLWRLSIADMMLAQEQVDEAIDQLIVQAVEFYTH